ncbi:MAG: hypothetical protein JXR96_12575 [Deltaproteobacteria bacterium]|nr:hypothetical protein [Deltaproteobacteria bacterium]
MIARKSALLAVVAAASFLARCGGETISYRGGIGDSCATNGECATGLECTDGTCQYPGTTESCTPQERRCNGKVVEACSSDGDEWTSVETCEVACLDGACVEPECARDEVRCSPHNDYDVQVCSTDQLGWELLYSCETRCEDGACTDRVCQPFARRCSGLDVQECGPRGLEWTTVTTCQESCRDGACTTSTPFDCGTEGTLRCNGNALERCSASGGWEVQEVCQTVCLNLACAECIPGDRICEGNDAQECSQDGSGYTLAESCTEACLDGECTYCVPGERICEGDNVMVCISSGSRYELLSACTTSCVNGACTEPVCVPFSTRCQGNTVQICNPSGTGYEDAEVCETRCENGRCVSESGSVCVPGHRRCSGIDVEACNTSGTGYFYIESCLDSCADGECTGVGCIPFALSPTPATVRADESSSALVVSDVICDASGNPVPDGTLFTLHCDSCRIGASDGDPNIAGVQVRSVEGRIDFSVISPAAEGVSNITATHPHAQRCSGTAQLDATLSAGHSFSEDFTSTAYRDEVVTTAKWDTAMGMVDPFPSDRGAGQDGELVVASGTFNINSSSSHGRLFPDGVNFKVLSVDSASVTVRGGVGGLDIGDEALLIQLQGPHTGNHEFLKVARIEYSTDTVFFSTSVSGAYDAASGQVMLQRVPRYSSMSVASSGTLTANAWNGETGGVLVVKVLGEVNINGTVDMTGKGYRSGWDACGTSNNYYPGESFSSPVCSDTTAANDGGGGGSYYSNRLNGYQVTASGAGYSAAGVAGNYSSVAGAAYGAQELMALFLGSGGGSARGTCEYYSYHGYGEGGAGGGAIYISAEGIAVWGTIESNGTDGRSGAYSCYSSNGAANGGGGSGGSILLRARSMNVGTDRVTARGGASYSAGAGGRIRLDYFGISGTTDPDFFEGFGGDAVVQTVEVDTTNLNILEVTLQEVLENTSGGSISYQVSNDGGSTFNDVTPGTPFTFPGAGFDLRIKAIFNTTSLNPLRLIGLAVSYQPG